MPHLRTIAHAALAVSFAAVSIDAAPRYAPTDLSELGFWSATAINNRGQIVGMDFDNHLLFYDGENVIDLGVGEGTGAAPADVNENGDIVGTMTFPGVRFKGFLYSNGKFTVFEGLPGDLNSKLAGITGRGVLTGEGFGPNGTRAFRQVGEAITALGTFGGGSTWAYAINQRGDIVGASNLADFAGVHAFFYHNDTFSDIGTLGGNSAFAYDVNDAAVIVGKSGRGQDPFVPCVWSAGRIVPLGSVIPMPPHMAGVADAINNWGEVVGTSGRPFVWSGGMLLLLQSLIDYADTGLGDISLPDAINDRGQILCGINRQSVGTVPCLLTPISHEGEPTRLANLSIRGGTHRGDETCILGFVVSGGEGSLLLRAVGPGLLPFGVTGAAANPRLDLFEHDTWREGNDDWFLAENAAEVAAAAERVHAFALGDGSADAAMLVRLPAGAYTFHTTAPDEGSGIALAEIYDAASEGAARLGNGSSRVHIGTGDDIGILGFSLLGEAPAKVLIRAVGPTLASFNVSGVLPDPLLWLYAGDSPAVGNDNWGTASGFPLLAQKTDEVSAFPLPDGSKDAALLLQLEPGSYTAQVSGVGGATGNVLIEIYLLP